MHVCCIRFHLSSFGRKLISSHRREGGILAITDFVIVAAASLAAVLSAPAAIPTNPAPVSAPTVGFNVYKNVTSCEQAAERLTPPAGKRLVCLPVAPYEQDIATAY